MKQIKDIEEKIVKLKSEIESLERQKADIKVLPFNKKLATVLHDKLCHWNHTDGCEWHYGNSNNDREWTFQHSARRKYLEMADNVLDHVYRFINNITVDTSTLKEDTVEKFVIELVEKLKK